MKRKIKIYWITIGVLGMVTMGCNHKDLEWCDEDAGDVEIIFDWTKAASADPESMGIHMYRQPNESPIRFSFSNKHGGFIRTVPGVYDIVAYNNDNTDWALLRTIETKEGFEITTPESGALQSAGISTRAIPVATGTENQPIKQSPGMLWTTSSENIEIKHSSSHQQIILQPEEAICHYTVRVLDVDHLDYLSGNTVDATLSGLAGGYHPGKKMPASHIVIHPLTLTSYPKEEKLEGNFLTFGLSPEDDYPHQLVLYMMLEDGTKWYYTFDVTNQVNRAPDPRNVMIEVRGLTLPKPEDSGAGFKPDVNDWQHENVDIKM